MRQALRCLFFFTLVTGLLYPLCITFLSYTFMREKAQGSLLLIGQHFEQPHYFWSRPSACNYNTLPSCGSNLGPTSARLQEEIAARALRFSTLPPLDLLSASGSGLDPHISLASAHIQVERVAAARQIEAKQIEALIEQCVEGGWLSSPHLNVLKLNLKLDELP